MAIEAFESQLRRWRVALGDGHERVGWKLAFGIDAVQAVRGERPMLGHLTSATRVGEGGEFATEPNPGLRFEAEVAVQVGEQLHVVGAVAAALEIVDVAQPQDDLMRVVEDNVLHVAYVLGPPVPPSELRESVTAIAYVDGREVRRETSRPPIVAGLREAAALLEACGEALEPGDWLITGSMAQTRCEPGTRASISITGLGEVAVRFV